MSASRRIPFSLNPLDPRFVAAKPKNSVKEEKIIRLEREGKLIITRKRDGYRHYAAIADSIRIYTRGIRDVTDHYPHIVKQFKKLRLPPSTLLDTEMIVDIDGKDDYEALAKIAKSDAKTAVDFQKNSTPASCMVFNVIAFDGQIMTEDTHHARLNIVRSLVSRMSLPHIKGVSLLDVSFADAKKMVLAEKWEGLVLSDAAKSTVFELHGNQKKPPRPEGCWKWKPHFEDDFIVRQWKRGTGKNANRMGKLYLSQIHPYTGKEVNCGEVGLGFSDQEREYFAHEATYPLVVQVEFQKRFPSGALFASEYIRTRKGDKSVDECLFPAEDLEDFDDEHE